MRDFKDLLRPGYSTDKFDGFHAEFKNGVLSQFGYYDEQGRPQGEQLYLNAADRSGRVDEVRHFYPDTADTQPLPPEEIAADRAAFEAWVAEWIANIYAAQDPKPLVLACSFCGKTQKEVRKLIAGPTVYICDECVTLCNDILEEERSHPPS